MKQEQDQTTVTHTEMTQSLRYVPVAELDALGLLPDYRGIADHYGMTTYRDLQRLQLMINAVNRRGA